MSNEIIFWSKSGFLRLMKVLPTSQTEINQILPLWNQPKLVEMPFTLSHFENQRCSYVFNDREKRRQQRRSKEKGRVQVRK